MCSTFILIKCNRLHRPINCATTRYITKVRLTCVKMNSFRISNSHFRVVPVRVATRDLFPISRIQAMLKYKGYQALYQAGKMTTNATSKKRGLIDCPFTRNFYFKLTKGRSRVMWAELVCGYGLLVSARNIRVYKRPFVIVRFKWGVTVLTSPGEVTCVFPEGPEFSVGRFSSSIGAGILVRMNLRAYYLLIIIRYFRGGALLVDAFHFRVALIIRCSSYFVLNSFIGVMRLTIIPFLNNFPGHENFAALFLAKRRLSSVNRYCFGNSDGFLLTLYTWLGCLSRVRCLLSWGYCV